MQNNMWIGSGISGMGEIHILGRKPKGLALNMKRLFSKGEQGFWYDPNPNIKDGWKVNLYTNTNDLTVAPIRATVVKTDEGFLFTATDVTPAGNHLLGSVYPAGSVASSINGKTIVRSIEVKKGTASILRLGGASDNAAIFVDLNTRAVIRNAGNIKLIIEELPDNWFRIEFFQYSLAFGATQLSNFIGWGMTYTASTFDAAGQVGSTINLRKPSFAVVNGESAVSVPYQEVTTEIELFLAQHPQPTLFQDSMGTVPVTAVDQPVGLILDKSKGVELGSERTVNGNFDDLSNWPNFGVPTKSVQNGVLKLESTAAQFPTGVFQDVPVPNHRTCKVVVRARKVSGTSDAKITLMPRSGDFNLPNTATNIIGNTFKDYIFYVTKESAATGIRVYFQMYGGDAVIEVDSVSVKGVAGNHAYQATSAARPKVTNRVNLFSNSEAFSGWIRNEGTPLDVANPKYPTAVKLVKGASTTYIHRNGISTPGTYTITGLFKNVVGAVFAVFANNGQVPMQKVGVTSDGLEIYQAQQTISSIVNSEVSGILLSNAGSSVEVYGIDARITEADSKLPKYQKTVSNTWFDTDGFPFYLYFDGVDDYLQIDGLALPSPMSTAFSIDNSTVVGGYAILLSPANAGYYNITASGIGTGGGTYTLRKVPKDVVFFKSINGKLKLKTSKAEGEVVLANYFATTATKYIGLYAPASPIKFNGSIYNMFAITRDLTAEEESLLASLLSKDLGA